ncbi:MAG TPA: methyltransferase domain-containing protein [Brevefilum sp.]|nr:methyltransferase domain-containing protein [Brevefilum sp.]HOR19909.1 methyltransferase domain-containing protein [Brevefilum sp.]HPL69551.1 methyltransferase domain-containing protein [Brevefilum sp.]
MSEDNIKQSVREFYDRVGWQFIGETLYQNAQYEDLRPVSQEYLHRCHMRVKRHLAQEGTYYLDAGSGPVQYPEYLLYSEGYRARVCMDISIVGLKEARLRLGEHGFFVVGDIVHLPFKSDTFDGISALHTIHHVPMDEKGKAFDSLYRVLKPGRKAVVVDGWTHAPLMKPLKKLMAFVKRVRTWREKRADQKDASINDRGDMPGAESKETERKVSPPQAGTFVDKFDVDGLINLLKDRMPFEILVWRSVSVAFLRSVIYPDWGGKFWLRMIYWLEERFPRLLGRIGQYPLIVIHKPDEAAPKNPSEV